MEATPQESRAAHHAPAVQASATRQPLPNGVSLLCHQIGRAQRHARSFKDGGSTAERRGTSRVWPVRRRSGHGRRETSTEGSSVAMEHIRVEIAAFSAHHRNARSGRMVAGRLPEQVLFQNGCTATKNSQSRQCAHARRQGAAPITRVLASHDSRRGMYVGANFFMQRMLNRRPDALDVAVLLQNRPLRRAPSVPSTQSARVDRRRHRHRRSARDRDHRREPRRPSCRHIRRAVVRRQTRRSPCSVWPLRRTLHAGNDNDADKTAFDRTTTIRKPARQIKAFSGICRGDDRASASWH